MVPGVTCGSEDGGFLSLKSLCKKEISIHLPSLILSTPLQVTKLLGAGNCYSLCAGVGFKAFI